MLASFLVVHTCPRMVYVLDEQFSKISDLKTRLITKVIDGTGFYISCNSKLVYDEDDVQAESVYHCVPTLVGGKGGFGSMLRAIGAQIEKTTSREACRDLSGRRMRDVNNEKKLKEWLAKQADREREKEEKRQERLARRRQRPQHNFDDPTYSDQKNKMSDDLEDALKIALDRDRKETGPSSTVTRTDTRGKRKATSTDTGKSKKAKEWLGVDMDSDLSSLDSDEDSSSSPSEDGAKAGISVDTEEDTPTEGSENLAGDQDIDTNIKSEPGSSSGEDQPTGQAVSPTCESTDMIKEETSETERKPVGLLASLPNPVNVPEVKTDVKTDVKHEDINLSDVSSSSELVELGMDRLKFALGQRGLKCGGTLQERAERLFSVKGLTRDQIDPALFPKSNGKGRKK